MRNSIFLISILFFFSSCLKPDETSQIPNTTFNHKIFEGKDVTAIAFDNLGNAWIASCNWKSFNELYSELIKYNINSKEAVVYNSSNSPIADTMLIWDLAVDKKNNLWIGCDGLIKFDGANFTNYNSKNTKIPVDFVRSIAIDSKDNIWFSSSSHLEGGFVKFDGTNWNVFTPENSKLPMNGVQSIAIDNNDQVWLAQYRYLNESCLVKISNDTWTVYNDKELGFSPPLWGNIAINSKKQVCGAIDYIFSDNSNSQRPQVILFDGVNCKRLQYDTISNVKSITVDNEDNIWCKCDNQFAVFDGNGWIVDSITFKNIRIETIVQSKDQEIWIGTENGIYINDEL